MPQTVLILDDESDNIFLMEETLRRKLRDVVSVSFTSPRAALAWCDKNEPDLCLIDYKMPDMSGIEFMVRARQNPRFHGVPVVMITGVTPADVRQVALASGATEFLSKPINPPDLVARVMNLLRLRTTLRNQRRNVTSFDQDVVAGVATAEQEKIIQRLCRFSEVRDEETGNHMRRMAFISQLIARELGYGEGFCDMILLAAPMHDIGKVGIPDRILLKPGRLDAVEWEIMKTHATIGYEVLKDSESELLRMGADIAHSHHEHFDGSGYPNRRAGEDIPIVGRIVAVADVFDALVNKRHYKEAWAAGDAFALLRREKGAHFDPECVDAMLKRIDEIMDIQTTYAEGVEVRDDAVFCALGRRPHAAGR
ncbi:MAG TPA: HD domain-containing phosphohydrolase [Acidiferrobacterales bacterium]